MLPWGEYMAISNAAPAPERCEVLVIGGGPGGSTVACLLAMKGRRVILLEKDHHPRFHIGESLLPMNLPILERLGVLDEVREIGIVKYGAEFNSAAYDKGPETFYFSNALNKNHPSAFEVRRSQFDHLLLRNSARKGADVREGMRVTAVSPEGEGERVEAVDEAGQRYVFDAAFVVDASGRDTFAAKQHDLKRKNPKHNTAAIFGHFEGAVRRPGRDEGNISIYWFEHGWFWMIPLKDGAMSVGAVCFPEYLKTRRNSPAEFLWDTIRLCPPVAERMRAATLVGEARATGNYSYTCTRGHVGRMLMVGDALAFIDPVFSSGVFIAMNGACLAAEVLEACLNDPASAERRLKAYDRRVRPGIKTFSWFIYRFTSPSLHFMFMHPQNHFRVQEAVISVLAGDVYDGAPIKWRLRLFKLMYYGTALATFARSWASYLRRRRNAQELFTGGTTPVDV
jgi:flavin-dependent dehydrogenase